MIEYLLDLRGRLQRALEEHCVAFSEWLTTVYQPAMLDIAAVDPGDPDVVEITDAGSIKIQPRKQRHIQANGMKEAA